MSSTSKELMHKDILKRFRRIVSVLRYLASTRQFSYVDRLAAAMSIDEVRAVVIEALRTVRSAMDASVTIIDTEENILKCCEVEIEGEIRPYAEGVARIVNVKRSSRPELVGKKVVCYECPEVPTEHEIAEFFDGVSKDLEVARTVAAYALSITLTRR